MYTCAGATVFGNNDGSWYDWMLKKNYCALIKAVKNGLREKGLCDLLILLHAAQQSHNHCQGWSGCWTVWIGSSQPLERLINRDWILKITKQTRKHLFRSLTPSMIFPSFVWKPHLAGILSSEHWWSHGLLHLMHPTEDYKFTASWLSYVFDFNPWKAQVFFFFFYQN